jgi:hypothetical protein
MDLQAAYDNGGNIIGCKKWDAQANNGLGLWVDVPLSFCKGAATSARPTSLPRITATSKFVGFMGMDGSPMGYLPLGIGALGGIAGFMLHKKYPKFGMAGKIGYIAVGAAAGFFITKEVMKKKTQ